MSVYVSWDGSGIRGQAMSETISQEETAAMRQVCARLESRDPSEMCAGGGGGSCASRESPVLRK